MNIYTYYEDVGFKDQTKLLYLWSRSWRKHGFNPRILTRKDAEQSPLFNEYHDFIQRVHKKISGKELYGYWLAAQLEIVAFHTIQEPSFISDYDVLNNNFYCDEELKDKVHWRDSCCSCFASGSGKGWEQYIKLLLDEEKGIVDWCAEEKKRSSRTEFGDQDFLIAVEKQGLAKDTFDMSRTPHMCCKFFPNSKANSTIKTFHVSHENTHDIQQKHVQYQSMSQDDIRLMCFQKIVRDL